MVKVEPQQGNTKAKLTAGTKTGSTTITVINKDNNAYATCRVTVTAGDYLADDRAGRESGYILIRRLCIPESKLSAKECNQYRTEMDNE